MSGREEIQKAIESVLGNSCLNRGQIRKYVTFQIINENHLSIKIDLHGLNLEETKDIIGLLVETKKLHIKILELVHGYQRGTVLKDYIEKDFIHSRILTKVKPVNNDGITKLYLKPWNEMLKKETKPRIKLKKFKDKSDSLIEKSEEDIVSDSLFKLVMIKEKIKESSDSGIMTYKTSEKFLNQEQLDSIKPLLEVSLTRGEFLSRILNIYVFQDKIHVVVGVNKLNLIETEKFIDKLLKLQSNHQVILELIHKNKKDKGIKDYILNKLEDDRIIERQINEDNGEVYHQLLLEQEKK